MSTLAIVRWALELGTKLFSYFASSEFRKLKSQRKQLEEDSKKAQVKGDLNALRRIRAEIDEVDRRLESVTPKWM